ncbi:Autoinducer 2 sensor kinase/phosphatase LuxQ [Thalassovita gelatinovora]|uniref:histidine kinase n=1 Tax=Thalassovita gelatinovora TaxID=53501 RepID=A0A0P1FEZ1_THAGE|nr:PAS-domain containing protein [Thalassovita gelatinovora]QIZ79737.1 PAS domain-containing protein [Thalassovita gelatinovora]CUH66735.1 Autoinducer 2 sensor kinase/phosphatase LuxQ [Thalassovita gelatinovora]SEQ41882.1 hypothetical protein SAMN04488043_105145 [Thalassovita gelatinovora]
MGHSLIDPRDSAERQNEKLIKITESLMRRVERGGDDSGAAYAQFQRAVILEEEVRARTRDLARALELLNESNAKLAQANRETEAAQSNLTNAIETVQEGFALFNSDEKLVMCNSRFGMHLPDIRDKMVPGLSFEDYVRLVSHSQFISLGQTETPIQWAARRMERHKDNHVIFNARMVWNRWVQVSEHRTPDGGTVILQTDVTDIMRLERRERDRMLDDQAKLIHATLDHLDQGVCIFDSQARLVGWNQRASELLSIPLGRFRMGINFLLLFERFRDEVSFEEGKSAQKVEDWVRTETERPPLSFELQHSNSKILTVFAQEMPDKGFVFSFTDVSAERSAVQAVYTANEMLEQRVIERTLELEDALTDAERANASKSRFVAAASHDLLQPLSAAKLYVGSVAADHPDSAVRSVLDRASNALVSVESILGALLDISKLDSGRASVHVGQVPLMRIMTQLQDELAPMALHKGLDLRMVPSSAVVSSDATYLRRILQNLMANAVRYTQIGRVLVGARRLKNAVRIEVHDTGPGIPEDQQDLIFREFHRVDNLSSASEGLGLGLAIVERACALLHHPLQIRSTPGLGTMFSIEVPLAQRESESTRQTSTLGAVPSDSLENMIVLLVENDAELRNALTIAMERWGVTVLACTTEPEARALIDEFGVIPDAIVADYQLDDGALGTALIEALRAGLGPVPSCLATANRSVEVSQISQKNGFHLMHKPIAPAELRAFLLSAFRQSMGK